MSLFERHIVVDWSGGNDTGPTPRKDAIWACLHGAEPLYFRNRILCEDWLARQIEDALSARVRLFIGFDFAFGYPAGFSRALTGSDDPLALWTWLEERIEDAPKTNNRFDLAGKINAGLEGTGPFWGNGLARDIDHLPRKGLSRTGHPFAERRVVEELATGSFPVWQLSGAGAVGSQVLMGLPVLARLRHRFAGQISAWPFEPSDRPIAFVEVWPSLIRDAVALAPDAIKDAAQTRILARAVAKADAARQLSDMLEAGAQGGEEGWILGAEAPEVLAAAAETLEPPRLTNDCFAMPQGVDWTPVDDALAQLESKLTPVVTPQSVGLRDAVGRRLALDAIALRANPPAANSAVDGYGFAHEAIVDGVNRLPLVKGRAAAGGAYDGAVPHGHAIRILTGAVIPDGVNCVVLQEDCATDGESVAFRGPLKPGANTRRAGEDVDDGGLAIAKGATLRAQDLALLTALGHAEVSVFQRLRVGVLSTGDELVEPAADGACDVAPDRTFDANRPMLLALAARWGHEAVDLGYVGDDREALRACLDRADCHAILTTGGASAGEEDHVSALLGETGSLNQWRIALKPGRPLALGVWNGAPIFGLPGNPVAAFTCALIFARPALSRMAGGAWLRPRGFQVPAAFTKRKKDGRREFLRARLTEDGRVEVFKSEGSGRISGLTWADGFVELPDGAMDVSHGTYVRYVPFGSFGL